MRLSFTQLTAAAVAAAGIAALAGCAGSDLAMPPNGPNQQFWSTNNALLRVVDGSPNAGPIGCTPAVNCAVDVFIDGSHIASGVPYGQFGILPYVSVPSGQALIQIYETGTTILVFEAPVPVSAGKKYSFVLAGQAPALPPPAPPFFPGFLFADGVFQPPIGTSMVNFHNASINAGTLQFFVTCAACPAGGENFGNPVGFGAGTVGPANLVPSGNYSLSGKNATTKSITPSNIDAADAGNVLPDPTQTPGPLTFRPNVSLYAVDTSGAGTANFQIIGVFDNNG